MVIMADNIIWAGARGMATLFVGIGLLFFTAVLGVFGHDIERTLFPVLINQRPHDVTRNVRDISFYLRLNKIRDCRFVSADWHARRGKQIVALDVSNPSRVLVGSLGSTLPLGELDLGPYRTVLPVSMPNAEFIGGNIVYDCHPLWMTRQVLVLIPVPPLQ